MAAKRQPDLAGQLRAALEGSGLTRAELARETGLAYSIIHGFMAGSRDITMGTASRLCALIDVELRRTRRRPGK